VKITIEGSPEEIAEALRKLAPAEDIKPILAPTRVPQIDPDFLRPYITEPIVWPQPMDAGPGWPTDRIAPWWGINHPTTGEPIGTFIFNTGCDAHVKEM
jgi:hypothetical protein